MNTFFQNMRELSYAVLTIRNDYKILDSVDMPYFLVNGNKIPLRAFALNPSRGISSKLKDAGINTLLNAIVKSNNVSYGDIITIRNETGFLFYARELGRFTQVEFIKLSPLEYTLKPVYDFLSTECEDSSSVSELTSLMILLSPYKVSYNEVCSIYDHCKYIVKNYNLTIKHVFEFLRQLLVEYGYNKGFIEDSFAIAEVSTFRYFSE